MCLIVTKYPGLADSVDSAAGRVAAPWRTTRTASGQFEGVLGFGQAQAAGAPSDVAPIGSTAGWRERQEKERLEKERVEREKLEEVSEQPSFGRGGGGPGWGNGQKKWRMAAGIDSDKVSKREMLFREEIAADSQTIDLPMSMPATDSVAATASGTPVPERDATVIDISSSQSSASTPQPEVPQEKEDFGSIEWFYRDPAGDEQGKLGGSLSGRGHQLTFQDPSPVLRCRNGTPMPTSRMISESAEPTI